MLRRCLLLLVGAFVLLALPTSASAAKVNVAVGIGDQNAKMFKNPLYTGLGVTKVRYFVHWDAASKPTELAQAVTYLTAARDAGARPLVHISTNNLVAKRAKLPSVAQYKKEVGALIKILTPLGVKEWGVWNEANHTTQPTWKSPKRAAEFYKAMKAMCRGCRLVALDVLDQKGVESYIKRWMAAAGPSGRTATVIGIHNYSEVNRRIKKGSDRYPGTERIINTVRKAKNTRAKFWYTETGGVVNFGGAFPCDRERPISRNTFMFGLAKKFDKDIERLYPYNFTGIDCRGFDAGLTEIDGSPRPAYAPFKAAIANFKR